jgi:hypothetical protein
MAELKLGEAGAAMRRQLRTLGAAPAQSRGADAAHRAFLLAAAGDVERWQTRREAPRLTPALVAPPGDPFGEEP